MYQIVSAIRRQNRNDLLMPSFKIVIEEFPPFGTAAITVTGSIDQDDRPRLWSYMEECQGLGATLRTLIR